MSPVDACGVPLSSGSPTTLDRYEEAVGMMLGKPGDAKKTAEAILAGDAGFVSGYCLRAALLVMSTDESEEPALRACLHAVEPLLPKANERERRHVAAARAWLERDFPGAVRLYGDLLVDHPRDRIALRAAHFGDFFLGQRGMLRDRIAQVLPHWNEGVPGFGFVLGMYAFGLQENGHYAQAEDAARRALEIERFNPGAVHAVAHVMEMQGRPRDGIAWLGGTASRWASGPGSATHHWWHLALFHLDLGETDKALEIYDTRIAAGEDAPLSSLADASALLWRLHLMDVPLGERWSRLARRWSMKRLTGSFPFHDLHALVAFIGSGDSRRIESVLRALERRAMARDSGAHRVREISLPIARALAAFARRDYGAAIDQLERVRVVGNVGASLAQRDALHLTMTEAALRHRRIRLARALAAERMALKPASALNRALSAEAELGLAA